MTYEMILDGLRERGLPAYDLKAPAKAAEAVVGHVYRWNTLEGSDSVLLRIEKVQLDVLWKTSSRSFLAAVCDALDEMYVLYDVIDISFDESFLCMRAILQMEAV